MAKVIRPHVYHTKNAGTRDGRKGTTPVDNLRKTGWGDEPKVKFDEGYDVGTKVAMQLTPEQQAQAEVYAPYAYKADRNDENSRRILAGNAVDSALTGVAGFIPGKIGTGLGALANVASGITQVLPKSPEDVQADVDNAYTTAGTASEGKLKNLVHRSRGDATAGDVAAQVANAYGTANQGVRGMGVPLALTAGVKGAELGAHLAGPSATTTQQVAAGTTGALGAAGAAYGIDKGLSKLPGSVVPRPEVAKTFLGKGAEKFVNPIKDVFNPQAVRTTTGTRQLTSAASKILPVARTLGRVAGPAMYALGGAETLAKASDGTMLEDIRNQGRDYIQNRGPSTASNAAGTTVQALSGDVYGFTKDRMVNRAISGRGEPELGRVIRHDVADAAVDAHKQPVANYAKQYYGSWLKPEHFANQREYDSAINELTNRAVAKWDLDQRRAGMATVTNAPQPVTGRPNALDRGIQSGEWGSHPQFNQAISNLGQQLGPANVYNPNTGGLGNAYLTGIQKATTAPGFKMPKFEVPNVDFSKAAPVSR